MKNDIKSKVRIQRIKQERVDVGIKDIIYGRYFRLEDIIRLEKGIRYRATIANKNISKNTGDSINRFLEYFQLDSNTKENPTLSTPMIYDDIIFGIQGNINNNIFAGWDYQELVVELDDDEIELNKNGKVSLLELCFIASLDAVVTSKKKSDFLNNALKNDAIPIFLTKMHDFLVNGKVEIVNDCNNDELDEDKYVKYFTEGKYCYNYIFTPCLEILYKHIAKDDWMYAVRIFTLADIMNTYNYNEKISDYENNANNYLYILLDNIFSEEYIDIYNEYYFKNDLDISEDCNYKKIYLSKIQDIKEYLENKLENWVMDSTKESTIEEPIKSQLLNILYDILASDHIKENIFNSRQTLLNEGWFSKSILQKKLINYVIRRTVNSKDYKIFRDLYLLNTRELSNQINEKAIGKIREEKRREILKSKGRGSKLNKKETDFIENTVNEYNETFQNVDISEYADVDKMLKTINEISQAICKEVPEILKAYQGNNLIKHNNASDVIEKKLTGTENRVIFKIIEEELNGLMVMNDNLTIGLVNRALLKFDEELKRIRDLLDEESRGSYDDYIKTEENYYSNDNRKEIKGEDIIFVKESLNQSYETEKSSLPNKGKGKPILIDKNIN